jgi:hypothetical protein
MQGLSVMRQLFAVLFASLTAAAIVVSSADGAGTPVQVQMRNVALHVDADTILSIRRLRGELVPTRAGRPPTFDDKQSFTVRISGAEIVMTTASLSQLMNRYVFAYDGSPLRKLEITAEGTQLKVKGEMHKGVDVPFTVVAEPRVDEAGNLRLKPDSIKTLGIPAGGLMSFFGLEMEELVKVKPGRGVQIDGNDFVLNPARLLPPPAIEGRLQSVRVEQDNVVQVFGSSQAAALRPPEPNTNYMYYRGGVLKFGKLTMNDADMELIDPHPADPFDFFQDRYNDQLVAGYSKNTPSLGLKVYMPDYRTVARGGR